MSYQERFMAGKEAGWYAGWWTDEGGAIGGCFFYPLFGMFLGNQPEKPATPKDFPPLTLKYWDGEKLHQEYQTKK